MNVAPHPDTVPHPARRATRRALVALVLLTIVALASLEFFHELGDHDHGAALVCTDPATHRSAFTDLLLMHMQSHR